MSHHSHWRATSASVEAYTPGCLTPKPPTWTVTAHHTPLHKLLEHPKMRRREEGTRRTEIRSKDEDESASPAFSFTVRQFRRSQRSLHAHKDHPAVEILDAYPHDDLGNGAQGASSQGPVRTTSIAVSVHVPTADEVLEADAGGLSPAFREGARIAAGQAVQSVLSKSLSALPSTLGDSLRRGEGRSPKHNALFRSRRATHSDALTASGNGEVKPELRHHTKHYAGRIYRTDLLPQPSLLDVALDQQKQRAKEDTVTVATPSPRPPFCSSVKGGEGFPTVSDADRHAHEALLEALALDDLCIHRKLQEERALSRRAAIYATRSASARYATTQRRPNFVIPPSATGDIRSTQVGVQLAVANATKLASRLDAASFPIDKRLARAAEVASAVTVGHVTEDDTVEKFQREALEHPAFTLPRSRMYGSNKYRAAPTRSMAYQADEEADGLALIAEFERTNQRAP